MHKKWGDVTLWILLLMLAGALLLTSSSLSWEFVVLGALLFMGLFKLTSINDHQLKLEMRFNALAKDFKEHLSFHHVHKG